MRRLAIDFAPRSIARALYRSSSMARLLLLIGVLACAGAAWRLSQLQEAAGVQRAVLIQTQASLHARDAPKPVEKRTALTPDQAHAINGAVAQLNYPWRDVLDAVESATPKTVALLTLEPDAKRALIKATVEAKTSDDMIGYVEQLKHEGFFSDVVLVRHEINEQDPNRPIRFQLEAVWKEGAR